MMTQAVNASSFSAFSSSYATDSDRTCELYKTSVVAVSSLLFPACLIGSLLSYQLLAIWIDPQFSAHSSAILKILCIGVFLSGVDSTTATFLEAIGRPDISTKISFGQLFLYLPLLYLFVTHLGVVGAAIAWSIRVFIDYTVRAAVCLRIYPMLRHTFFRGALSVIAGGSMLLLSMLPMSFAMTIGAALLSLALFYVVVWWAVLDTTERAQFLSFVAKIRRRIGGRPGEGRSTGTEQRLETRR
jgi:O-antigen/teichoic acid export membrane protein